MEWLWNLMTNHESVAYTVIVYSVVIAVGVALGKIKIFGISFGIAWVLFAGIAMAELGFTVNPHIQHFVKEFGLILFVYTIGLQVGPGFFASFQKEGIKFNLLAVLSIVSCVLTVIAIHYITQTDMGTLVGIMSGAVTNTPGLGAAQATLEDVFKAFEEVGTTKGNAIQSAKLFVKSLSKSPSSFPSKKLDCEKLKKDIGTTSPILNGNI